MSLTIYYTDKFCGGREESRRILRTVLGGDAEILEGEFGKPYVPGGPEFSISHSDNYYALLLADTPCGIDIQLSKKANYTGIAERFFSEREADLIETLGEDAFFKIWTRREALVKSAGRSVFTDELPELLMPPEPDVLCVEFDGAWRAVMDIDFPMLYMAVCWTVDDRWQLKREVPMMRRLDI